MCTYKRQAENSGARCVYFKINLLLCSVMWRTYHWNEQYRISIYSFVILMSFKALLFHLSISTLRFAYLCSIVPSKLLISNQNFAEEWYAMLYNECNVLLLLRCAVVFIVPRIGELTKKGRPQAHLVDDEDEMIMIIVWLWCFFCLRQNQTNWIQVRVEKHVYFLHTLL